MAITQKKRIPEQVAQIDFLEGYLKKLPTIKNDLALATMKTHYRQFIKHWDLPKDMDAATLLHQIKLNPCYQ